MQPATAIHHIPVHTPEQIRAVADLAVPIWQKQFTPIIGPEQVAFMLEDWQSPMAIKKQIQAGAKYFLVQQTENNRPIGYLAWIREPKLIPPSAKVSKFYLMHAEHGRGYAQQMMQFIEENLKDAGVTRLWLQVNRQNHRAICFYKKVGFSVIRNHREEVGPGFFIDDHIMQKNMEVTG